jgi:hypothetical protein
MSRFGSLVVAALVAVAVVTVPAAPASAAAPSRPGVVVEPLGTGAGCIIQSRFGTELGGPGNFETVVQQGPQLVHYWRGNADPAHFVWHKGQVVSSAATGPGCIIQSDGGNLEVVVQEGSRLRHYWHDSSQPTSAWHAGLLFGTNVTSGPSIIQSDFISGGHGRFEVVVREGTSLVHYWHDSTVWSNPWNRGGTITTSAASGGSLIQSDFRSGTHGNFEVLVQEGDHISHLWHDNNLVANPWNRALTFGSGSGVSGAPSLIQGGFVSGGHGNLEAVVRQGSRLVHWWHDSGLPTAPWNQARDIVTSVNTPPPLSPSVNSSGSLIRSTLGASATNPGNFEVVVLVERPATPPYSRVRGGLTDFNLVHYWHDNSGSGPWARAQAVTYRGRSEKVCQLTGYLDEENSTIPTSNTGLANVGFVDLGYPVDDGATLRMYFGDTVDDIGGHALDETGLDDTVGWSTDIPAPTWSRCLGLNIVTASPGQKASPVVKPHAPDRTRFLQGLFNVPASGFRVGGTRYMLFWTDHCRKDMRRGVCEDPSGVTGVDTIGRTALTRATSETTFDEKFTLPAPFHYAGAAVNTNTVSGTGLPAGQQGVYVYGVDRYRLGYPYLAFVPEGTVETPGTWKYYKGLDAAGAPQFDTIDKATRLYTTGDLPSNGIGLPGCLGEMHVSWVGPPLSRWLMVYNCEDVNGPDVIKARVAPAPWGPWSEPTEIFHPDTDGGWCRFMHHNVTPACDALVGGPTEIDPESQPYGPAVLSRYNAATANGVELTFVMSTWIPYQVVVMRTELTASP